MPNLGAKTFTRLRQAEQRLAKFGGTIWNRTIHTIGGGTAAAATNQPFDIALTEVASPDYHITLIPGGINQLVPTNMLAVTDYDNTTTRFVSLDVTTDGRKVTSSVITIGAAAPAQGIGAAQAIGPTSFSMLIGVVALGTIYQIWRGMMLATLTQSHLEDRDPPVIGMSPIIRWYTWVVEVE